MERELTDRERFPLLTDAGAAMLRRLREHPAAPRYNFLCGERLDEQGLADVQAFAQGLDADANNWGPGRVPAWVPAFAERCRRDVPFYRRREGWDDGGDFLSLPLLHRDAIRREPWAFVPDSADFRQLITYYTSGTTGDRMYMPSHPVVGSRYLPLLGAALATHGVELAGGAGRVSLARVSSQQRTFTYPGIASYLGGAGFVKVNLNPADWREPDDRLRYLDSCDVELYASDPIALGDLAALPLGARPRAVVSAGTALLPGMKAHLERRFGCPVVDLYSLCEFGPVACSTPGGEGHAVLPWQQFVEVVDDAGRPCPPGARGEVVLTGSLNPLLPMVRYRTADHAALDFSTGRPRLVGLEGRRTVRFQAADGRVLPSIDVHNALGHLPLPFLSLKQRADGDLLFVTRADEDTLARAVDALHDLFGRGRTIGVERVPAGHAWQGKPIHYASDLAAQDAARA